MTEWEQLKKEYREIPVPENGLSQMRQAMERARKKRSRLKNLAGYSTVAAAMLLLFLLPGMLMTGGFGTSGKDASMKADGREDAVAESNRFNKYTTNDMAFAPTADGVSDNNGRVGRQEKVESEAAESVREEIVFTEEQWEDIRAEVLRQMEERMYNDSMSYDIEGEQPDTFFAPGNYPEYYVNDEGLLVIVFEAGTMAPKELGILEFVIPAEVIRP